MSLDDRIASFIEAFAEHGGDEVLAEYGLDYLVGVITGEDDQNYVAVAGEPAAMAWGFESLGAEAYRREIDEDQLASVMERAFRIRAAAWQRGTDRSLGAVWMLAVSGLVAR